MRRLSMDAAQWILAVFLMATPVLSQETAPTGLSIAVKDFLNTWFVKKDVNRATSYLSRRPVIGTCMTSEELDKKKHITRRDIESILQKALSVTLKKGPPSGSLSRYVSEKDTDVIGDAKVLHHPNERLFRIIHLKPFDDVSDNGYVCKFDERPEFLQAISSPDVYYVLNHVNVTEKYESFGLLTVWRRDGSRWKILTFSVFTNDD